MLVLFRVSRIKTLSKELSECGKAVLSCARHHWLDKLKAFQDKLKMRVPYYRSGALYQGVRIHCGDTRKDSEMAWKKEWPRWNDRAIDDLNA